MSDVLSLIAIVLLILCSAFFSGSEIAFATANKLRLQNNAQSGKLYDRLALTVYEKYDDILASILIGNNLVNVAASSVATVIVLRLLPESYSWLSTVCMTLLILTFGEILPKVIAKQRWQSFVKWACVPLYVLWIILYPVVFTVMLVVKLVSKLWEKNSSDTNAVSEEDFENLIDIAEDEGVLDEEDCDLLQNALDFDEVLACEVITPRVDMTAIDIHDPFEKNREIIFNSIYSRVPVYEDTPDNIIGVLLINRVLKEMSEDKKINIRNMLLPAVFVHKTMPLPDVLDKMRSNKTHMVVVLDEYGGTMGILTMEDILEQLVGEIWDESDDIEREFVCIDDTHFEALGEMRIYDFFDEFDIDAEDTDFEDTTLTVGGWVVDMLEGEVENGSTFEFEFLKITVLDVDGVRIERVGIEVMHDDREPQEEVKDLL